MRLDLFYLITAFVSFSTIAASPIAIEYIQLIERPLKSNNGYPKNLRTYFEQRGVSNQDEMIDFVREDLTAMAKALHLLFEQETHEILKNYLGKNLDMVNELNLHIDHVGIELYGPLSFYLPILKWISPDLGIEYLKQITFPSTQVVQVLKKYDPKLESVTIARVYFRKNDKTRCLELFQTAPQDETSPQPISETKLRRSLLTAKQSNSPQMPIDHISVQLETVEAVNRTHSQIHKLSSETLQPYHYKISYNPADGSTQTKVLLRDSKEEPFNKIIEFVHYSY